MAPLILSRRCAYGTLSLLWMVIIFVFSSIHGSGTYFEPPLWYVLERKGAHVTEFFILAFLIASFLSTHVSFRKDTKLLLSTVFLFCVTYALSDEIHQFFVFGREARFTDVLIDTGGVFLGTTSFFFWQHSRWCKRIFKKTFKTKTSH